MGYTFDMSTGGIQDVTYCNQMVHYLNVNGTCVFFYVFLIVSLCFRREHLLTTLRPKAMKAWIHPATRRQSDHWAVCSKQVQAPPLPPHLPCSWSKLLKLNLTATCCPPPLTVRQTLWLGGNSTRSPTQS